MRTALILTFLVLFSVASINEVLAIDYQINENHADLLAINKDINRRWEKFEDLQRNDDWLESQLGLQYYGPIYQKGWYGPHVERQILPAINGDYLVMDSITLGPHYLKQMAIVGGNFLFKTVVPYLQGAPIEDRRFSKITRVSNYEEALKLTHMEVTQLPTTREKLNQLNDGEQFNTILLSGFSSRVSLPWMNFLDIAIPNFTKLGPQAKLKIQKSLDVTIEKAQEDIALITIKHIDERSKGFGSGLNLILDEIIELPISIGINGSNGYSPIVFNVKSKKKEIQELIYRIDLSTPEGQKAYESFLNQDFTLVQDLEEQRSESVELYIRKDGQVSNKEFNWGLNLILFKSGARYIKENSKFTTTFNNGDKYHYDVIEQKKITDHKGFSGQEKRNYEVRAIVPTNDDAISSFSLDITYSYTDMLATGRELNKESKFLLERYLDNGMRIDFDKKKQYGKVQLYSTLMFSTKAIKELMEVDDYDLWEAIALSNEYVDSLIWIDANSRNSFKESNTVYRHGEKRQDQLNAYERKKQKQLERLEVGQMVYQVFNILRSNASTSTKAKLLVKNLRDNKIAPTLQKTMVNIIGINDLMGQGYIRGNLY